jgi:hypothetical protein
MRHEAWTISPLMAQHPLVIRCRKYYYRVTTTASHMLGLAMQCCIEYLTELIFCLLQLPTCCVHISSSTEKIYRLDYAGHLCKLQATPQIKLVH